MQNAPTDAAVNVKHSRGPWRPKLTRFINAVCTICPKIGLGHETQMAETKTSASRDRDVDNFCWNVRDRDHNPTDK